MTDTIIYPFTEAEFEQANREYGCNCGPAALAFACQIPLDAVRGMIPDFETKGFTSPTMMMKALHALDREWSAIPQPDKDVLFSERMSLVRIQWTGRWTAPGANPRWAYRFTHWIATWRVRLDNTPLGSVLCPPTLFDCNGGVQRFTEWEAKVVPAITAQYPRADGGWMPTHIWRLAP